jgi:hypothetical protein
MFLTFGVRRLGIRVSGDEMIERAARSSDR